jgi:modulator of FtsH protease HflC
MRVRSIVVGVLALLLVVVAFGTLFTVAEHEQVLITRFGRIHGEVITRAGLHVKMPFVDDVHRFDRRWLEWDGDPNQIPTGDKKYIWVDTYGRWRITDPVVFYKRLRDERSGQSRIDDIVDGQVRNVIANEELIELVRSTSREFELGRIAEASDTDASDFVIAKGREALRRRVHEESAKVMPSFGIELGDVRIKRINYVESVQAKVFDRMVSERQRIAERYRSEGQGKAAEIRGRIDRELREVRSEAYRQAEEIQGRGDAEAASIYAGAYRQNPKLYEFTKSLDAYRKIIDDETLLVLSTDSPLFRFLQNADP